MMKIVLSIIAGSILLANAASAGESAATVLKSALTTACQPWMGEAVLGELSPQLEAAGWTITAEAIFVKTGSWGRVQGTLSGPPGKRVHPADKALKENIDRLTGATPQVEPKPKRTCMLSVYIDENPWTAIPAETAISNWIAAAYPTSAKTSTGTVIIDARTLDATAWVADDLKFTQATQRSKQKQPDFDLLFFVKRE
ncbi:MAG: hypothetical protein K8S25_04915 [Alphaproteobacteria bacterium]|nr:hypothetical protein [Alphaproteobacteria bacterium]